MGILSTVAGLLDTVLALVLGILGGLPGVGGITGVL
jgi:hypothetical protein